jgi:hypothetical protein
VIAIADGAVIAAVAEALHPFASMTVTVQLPLSSPLAVAGACVGVVFHE